MTKLFQRAVETAQTLPDDVQDEIARMMLLFAGEEEQETEDSAIQLTADEEASFSQSLAQADRREFASDEQVKAVWSKYGL